MTGIVATASLEIAAPPERIWDALVDPAQITTYMFGSEVQTDWQVGGPITWRGEYEGRSYEDKGQVVELEPPSRMVVTHFSPLGGQDDVPENYHTLTYTLTEKGSVTEVSLSQDNNDSEEAAEHARGNWQSMLVALKEHVEGS